MKKSCPLWDFKQQSSDYCANRDLFDYVLTPNKHCNNALQATGCTATTMAVGDSIDNDCDGLFDEELCTPSGIGMP